MKRDLPITIPMELREAEELLERYGRWAQDRYRKNHCASAEHKYRPPRLPGDEPEPEPFIADFRAMDVQHALAVVPMQYRRVLQAIYIPQRLPQQAIRRKLGVRFADWHQRKLIGLRIFWSIYCVRYRKNAA